MLTRKVSVFLHATFHIQNRYPTFDQNVRKTEIHNSDFTLNWDLGYQFFNYTKLSEYESISRLYFPAILFSLLFVFFFSSKEMENEKYKIDFHSTRNWNIIFYCKCLFNI